MSTQILIMAWHNDLCGGTRVARSPLYRTVTRGPWRACLSCLALSGFRQWDTSTWGAWGTSDVPWVPRAWVSGKTCLLASLQVWLSRRQHLCSNLTAAVLFTVVLCVLHCCSSQLCCVCCCCLPYCCALLRPRLPLQAPTSAALWVKFSISAKNPLITKLSIFPH